MAMLVHLTPADNAGTVRRGGIKAHPHRGLGVRGVFAGPVLRSYTLTYQWGRELRRRQVRTFVAVHFRVPDEEDVWVGHYGHQQIRTTAAAATALIAEQDDPRGYEIFLPRRVFAGEVHRLRAVSPVTGWRYFPDAHGRRPCACPMCLRPGEYGARKIRERFGQD